jgi:hypothetical protein
MNQREAPATTMLYEYFAAPSDEAAVSVLQVHGGPVAAKGASWDAIDGRGVEPSVNLPELEELLTGVEYDDLIEDPRAGNTLARLEDEAMVITLSDSLHEALAKLPVGRIAGVAGEWSHSEEFGGDISPGDLTGFLTDLVKLAQRAAGKGQRLYCWVSVSS